MFHLTPPDLSRFVLSDICTLTQSLLCRGLPRFLFLFFLQLIQEGHSSVCAKLILTRARTQIDQDLSFISSLRKKEKFTLSF